VGHKLGEQLLQGDTVQGVAGTRLGHDRIVRRATGQLKPAPEGPAP